MLEAYITLLRKESQIQALSTVSYYYTTTQATAALGKLLKLQLMQFVIKE